MTSAISSAIPAVVSYITTARGFQDLCRAVSLTAQYFLKLPFKCVAGRALYAQNVVHVAERARSPLFVPNLAADGRTFHKTRSLMDGLNFINTGCEVAFFLDLSKLISLGKSLGRAHFIYNLTSLITDGDELQREMQTRSQKLSQLKMARAASSVVMASIGMLSLVFVSLNSASLVAHAYLGLSTVYLVTNVAINLFGKCRTQTV